MPRYDRTGPLGYGPQTGRGMGSCDSSLRRGRRFGFSPRGFRSKKNELSALDEEEKILKEELQIIQEEKKALNAQK